MWFLFGVVTLTLAVIGSFWLRRQSGWVGESVAVVDAEGRTHEYQWQESKHKGKPVGFRIGVLTPAAYQFRLLQEGWLQRFGASLGIGAEQTVGDSAFDQAFFIDSDDPRVGQALRRSIAARRALLDLRNQMPGLGGVLVRVTAFRGRLWIDVSSRQAIPDATTRHAIVMQLLQFDDALREQEVGSAAVRDPFLFRAILFLALSTGLAIFGLVGLARLGSARMDLDSGSLWLQAVGAGIVLCLGLSFAALKTLQQSSRAYRVLAELLTIGLFGSILSSHALIFEFNRDFDSGVPTVYAGLKAHVRSETYKCGKHRRSTCTRHILKLDGDCPPEIRELRISSNLASQLRVASTVQVEVKPGALGGRWISEIRPEMRLDDRRPE
ncbi:hypothetical protein C7S18_14390 [Ahniella affigens]|uniref:Uncharacterized protein n=1 Tax=Ahniella affigens TaxID=2021234 RepID=A0A2P1PTY8_9GAMM|nr:hypothetical protein [Ahniella affigens]AVP98309.1 hypothetical protein C7S18_14390 [Ahniella affigens]